MREWRKDKGRNGKGGEMGKEGNGKVKVKKKGWMETFYFFFFTLEETA